VLRGSRCRCGFATVGEKILCPRCGRRMKAAEWPEEGTVLSFVTLGAELEGHKNPVNLLLVGIAKGPKLICWTESTLSEGDMVLVCPSDKVYHCFPKESSGRAGA
jgi:uncharacterized OB-fold protein